MEGEGESPSTLLMARQHGDTIYVHSARGTQSSHRTTQAHPHLARVRGHGDVMLALPRDDDLLLHGGRIPYVNQRTRSGDYIDAPPWEYGPQLLSLAMLTREYVSTIRNCHHSSRRLYEATLHEPSEWLISPYHPDLSSVLEGLGSDVWSLATVCLALPNRSTAEVLDHGRQTNALQNFICGLNMGRGASLRYGD